MPNSPLSFPNPFGNLSDFDCKRIEAEAIEEAHKKTTFALYI